MLTRDKNRSKTIIQKFDNAVQTLWSVNTMESTPLIRRLRGLGTSLLGGFYVSDFPVILVRYVDVLD